MEYNFGYGGEKSEDTGAAAAKEEEIKTNLNGDSETTDLGELKTGEETKENTKSKAEDANKKDDGNEEKKEEIKSAFEEGTIIDADGVKYTIDKDGNAVDAKGEVFKKATEVQKWIDSFEPGTDDNELSIQAIQDSINITVVDDNDKPIEFENTNEGIVSYINAVMQANKDEVANATIEALYNKYPILENVLNYYVANGNSLDGFGEVQDRTKITIDSNNESQQEYIIRTAWKEQGRKGDVDRYIQYIKSQNQLFDVAKEELEGLQERDKEYLDEIAKKADEAEKKHIELQKAYWSDVKEAVDSRSIAGYKLPETIVINRNGQKTSATPNDFFNYVYQVDGKGKSAYEYALEKESPKERMNNELLAAYIKFSGGDYTSLVNMAIKENDVKTIKLKSAAKTTSKTKSTSTKQNNTKDIDFGW